MNAGPTSTRIYDALLEQLQTRRLRPGTRLDPIHLADDLRSSPTPVRDALHILAGEELVTALPNGGFITPVFDEHRLADLYGWNGDVLTAALRSQVLRPVAPAPREIMDLGSGDLADRAAAVFQWIADDSSNTEHGRVQARINARLHGARMAESALIKDADDELNTMIFCFENYNFAEMRRLVARYTIKRKRLVGNILMAIQSYQSK
jgi:DNA-binding transcriptional MocR family regulator